MIQELTPEVRAEIVAPLIVQSLQHAVHECICNSVDAASTEILVEIDSKTSSAVVTDNGEGISSTDFTLLGGKSCTSKPLPGTASASQQGFRGQALYAIAVTSPVEITSKRYGEFQTWKKVFRGRTGSTVGLAAHQWTGQGTRVSINSFMAYQPVRRAQLLQAKGRETELAIRQIVLAVALPFTNIHFSVKELRTGALLLDLPKERSLHQTLPELFGNCEPAVASLSRASLNVTLALSASSAAKTGNLKLTDFLYINKRRIKSRQIRLAIAEVMQQAHCQQQDEKTPLAYKRQMIVFLLLECPHHSCRVTACETDGATVELLDLPEILDTVQKAAHQALSLQRPRGGLMSRESTTWTQEESLKECGLQQSPATLSQNTKRPIKATSAVEAQCQMVTLKSAAALGVMSRSTKAEHPYAARMKERSQDGPRSCGVRPCLRQTEAIGRKRSKSLCTEPSGRRKWEDTRETALALGGEPKQQQQHHADSNTHARQVTPSSQGPIPFGQVSLDDLLAKWKNPCVGSRLAILSVQDLHQDHVVPTSISREELALADVLNQAVDQHAADERVKLEHLQKSLHARENSRLDQPIVLRLNLAEMLACAKWPQRIRSWGWDLSIHTSAATATIKSVPNIMGTYLTLGDLQAYLQRMSDTNGAVSIPDAVQKVLASKACRSAVMFGDRLSMEEAQDIMEGLKQTVQCFKCAHGRPTMAPLVHLPTLKEALLRSYSSSATLPASKRIPLQQLKAKLLASLERQPSLLL